MCLIKSISLFGSCSTAACSQRCIQISLFSPFKKPSLDTRLLISDSHTRRSVLYRTKWVRRSFEKSDWSLADQYPASRRLGGIELSLARAGRGVHARPSGLEARLYMDSGGTHARDSSHHDADQLAGKDYFDDLLSGDVASDFFVGQGLLLNLFFAGAGRHYDF